MPLIGKIAIVTGGARGIGRGIVLTLAKQGAKIAFTYVSSSSSRKAEDLVAEVEGMGTTARAHAMQADSADVSAPQKIIDSTFAAFDAKNIDILVNNAGVGSAATILEEITLQEYDNVMTVNVRSVIFMTQAVLPCISKGGRIVNISSISARGGYATQSVYSASKAAVEALTRVWATELGPRYGVTVNCVNPGPVDTEMYRSAGDVHLAKMEELSKKTPAAPRAGTEKDVAEIVTFLCEERSRWISGDTVCANGGFMFI